MYENVYEVTLERVISGRGCTKREGGVRIEGGVLRFLSRANTYFWSHLNMARIRQEPRKPARASTSSQNAPTQPPTEQRPPQTARRVITLPDGTKYIVHRDGLIEILNDN